MRRCGPGREAPSASGGRAFGGVIMIQTRREGMRRRRGGSCGHTSGIRAARLAWLVRRRIALRSIGITPSARPMTRQFARDCDLDNFDTAAAERTGPRRGCLRWRRECRWRLGIQQRSAACRPVAAAAVSHPAEVPDAHKILGQHVQQEAPEELFGRQSHLALLGAMGIILPAEGDLAILHRNQPMVGDGQPRRRSGRLCGYDNRNTASTNSAHHWWRQRRAEGK